MMSIDDIIARSSTDSKKVGQDWYNDYGPYHFHNWYREFRGITPESAMFKFPWQDIPDWISFNDDESKNAETRFFNLASLHLQNDDSFCIYKLSTRSPKDYCIGGLPLFHNPSDAFTGFKCSMRTFDDLAMHANAQIDPVIVMRHFHPEILANQEYRLYVHSGILKGVSVNQHGMSQAITRHERLTIELFFEAIRERLHDCNIVDAAIDIGYRHRDRISTNAENLFWLIEINPFWQSDPIHFRNHQAIIDSYARQGEPVFLHKSIHNK